ncbi:hypothetical protein J3F83DRAFT_717568 [Trichoderma novae-zelandiae]
MSRVKYRELRSRAAQQEPCVKTASLPGFDSLVNAELCMMDVPDAASWDQPDDGSILLLDNETLDTLIWYAGHNAANFLDHDGCPRLNPALPLAWGSDIGSDSSSYGFGLDPQFPGLAGPYARPLGGREWSVDEAIDYTATDEEVNRNFTHLITYMKNNNLSVNDLMETKITTESTLNVTNFTTTNFVLAEDYTFTPFTAPDGTDTFTLNNATDTFTASTNTTTHYPMLSHLNGTKPVHVRDDTAWEPEPTSFDPGNGIQGDEDMDHSPASSHSDASYDLDPDGRSKAGYKWCCGRWRKNDGNFK